LLKAAICSTTQTQNEQETIILFSDGNRTNLPPNTDGALNLAALHRFQVVIPLRSRETGRLMDYHQVCPVTLGDISTPGNTLMSNIGNAKMRWAKINMSRDRGFA